MRPVNSLKSALFNSLYRSSITSTLFATLIVLILIFISIEKDLRQEGNYLGQFVFKELREAMNRGATLGEMNQLIHRLNQDAPDISYNLYRGGAVQRQFGEGRPLSAEHLEIIGSNKDGTQIESLDKIHYLEAIRFKQECLACHQQVAVGELAGVLDVTFPASRVRIPISEVLMGLFLVFSITMISSYLTLSRDLMAHIIQPLLRLERRLKKTEGHHDLNQKLELNSDLKEVQSIEHSFNAQQELLHNAFQKVEEVSIYDKLTSTFNRHQLDRLVNEETNRAMRQQSPLTLTMIDLNGFKKINDTHGHQAGDAILSYFCQVLMENLRASDKVVRYGGDEFIVLLPDFSHAEADRLFMRVAARCQAQPYNHHGQSLPIFFSHGSVEYPLDSDTTKASELIGIADQRMYEDKLRKKSARNAETLAGLET